MKTYVIVIVTHNISALIRMYLSLSSRAIRTSM
jgi:hypothetical protein